MEQEEQVVYDELQLLSLAEIEALPRKFLVGDAPLMQILPLSTNIPINPLNHTVALLPTNTSNVAQIVFSKQVTDIRKAMSSTTLLINNTLI
jgi:hypothetical protein